MLPTLLEAAQISLPKPDAARGAAQCEGSSFLSDLRGNSANEHTLYWEHTGNAAIRRGRWKLVCEYPHPWELYDMNTDRAETNNLAESKPDIVHELLAQWEVWANRVGVVPWDRVLAGYRAEGKHETEAAG